MTEAPRSLSDDEIKVLAGLARALVRADGHTSAAERDMLASVAAVNGGDVFWRYVDEAGASGLDAAQALEAASVITNQDVQEHIYLMLFELSRSDVIDGDESDLLDQLSSQWGLEVEDLGPDLT